MNRRELFHRMAGIVAGAGVVAKVSVVEAETKPVLVLFEADGPISQATAEHIKATWNSEFSAVFPGVKCAVLGDGLKVSILDANGTVLNKRLTDA